MLALWVASGKSRLIPVVSVGPATHTHTQTELHVMPRMLLMPAGGQVLEWPFDYKPGDPSDSGTS